jgi:hypothetical protein
MTSLRAQDLGDRPMYDVKDLIAPRLNEFGYSVFLKLLKSWPLGRFLVWKIKSDSEFHIVEKLSARLYNVPLHVPVARPSEQQILTSKTAASLFNLEDFVKQAHNNENSMPLFFCFDNSKETADVKLVIRVDSS